jgi:hypothetical protein
MSAVRTPVGKACKSDGGGEGARGVYRLAIMATACSDGGPREVQAARGRPSRREVGLALEMIDELIGWGI